MWSDYSRAVENTRCLAQVVDLLLQQLTSPTTTLHCIGHSLGAHVCGFLSNKLETSRGKRMERITGLDPAGINWTTRRTGLMKVMMLLLLFFLDRLDEGGADARSSPRGRKT